MQLSANSWKSFEILKFIPNVFPIVFFKFERASLTFSFLFCSVQLV